MRVLTILRQQAFLSERQLGRLCRLPARSIADLENSEYPLQRIGVECRAVLESELQRALNTGLALNALLAEA